MRKVSRRLEKVYGQFFSEARGTRESRMNERSGRARTGWAEIRALLLVAAAALASQWSFADEFKKVEFKNLKCGSSSNSIVKKGLPGVLRVRNTGNCQIQVDVDGHEFSVAEHSAASAVLSSLGKDRTVTIACLKAGKRGGRCDAEVYFAAGNDPLHLFTPIVTKDDRKACGQEIALPGFYNYSSQTRTVSLEIENVGDCPIQLMAGSARLKTPDATEYSSLEKGKKQGYEIAVDPRARLHATKIRCEGKTADGLCAYKATLKLEKEAR
jgi:hypothetical protein